MMGSKVLIIGNGFDLDLGLETSYGDFLDSDYFRDIYKEGNEIAAYIKRKANSEKNWVDIECYLKDYADDIERNQEVSDFLKFRQNYKELVETLSKYLQEIGLSKQIDASSRAFKFLQRNCLSGNGKAKVKIYNFNYTPTVEIILRRIWGYDPEIKKVLTHVHNDLDSNIIFGIQDDVADTRYHGELQKAASDDFRPSNLSRDLAQGYNVAFFGYSLGLTDEEYFRDPFHQFAMGVIPKFNMEIYHRDDDEDKDQLKERIKTLISKNWTRFKDSVNLYWNPDLK